MVLASDDEALRALRPAPSDARGGIGFDGGFGGAVSAALEVSGGSNASASTASVSEAESADVRGGADTSDGGASIAAGVGRSSSLASNEAAASPPNICSSASTFDEREDLRSGTDRGLSRRRQPSRSGARNTYRCENHDVVDSQGGAVCPHICPQFDLYDGKLWCVHCLPEEGRGKSRSVTVNDWGRHLRAVAAADVGEEKAPPVSQLRAEAPVYSPPDPCLHCAAGPSGALSCDEDHAGRDEMPDGPHPDSLKKFYFLDMGCGLGGLSCAAKFAGWEGWLGSDFCDAYRRYYECNFGHPFLCADFIKPRYQDFLVRICAGVVKAVLFSAPCQPYCQCGARVAGDQRVQVMVQGIKIILRIRPLVIVLEQVPEFLTCKWNPVWKTFVLPALEDADYHVTVVHSNAKQCHVPMNRHRIWIVATLYPRTGVLERRMKVIECMPETVLSEFFPSWTHVRFSPYRGGPGVFDARKKAHPGMRTCCAVDWDVTTYKSRRRDSTTDLSVTVFPTLYQRKLIVGLPACFELPPLSEFCSRKQCCAHRRRPLPLVSVGLGNIVCPLQALEVLDNLEIPTDAWEDERPGLDLDVLLKEAGLDAQPPQGRPPADDLDATRQLVRQYVANLEPEGDLVRPGDAQQRCTERKAAASMILSATHYVLPEAASSVTAQEIAEDYRQTLYANHGVRLERQ